LVLLQTYVVDTARMKTQLGLETNPQSEIAHPKSEQSEIQEFPRA